MRELVRTLIGNGVAAPPANILDGIDESLAHLRFANAPHTMYEELWHLAFWQELSLAWIGGSAVPYPLHAAEGFPPTGVAESWEHLRARFLNGLEQAAGLTHDLATLERTIACPSLTGHPARTMTVREQLESVAADNAYHLGRVVLLRQLCGAWPPASGGDTW